MDRLNIDRMNAEVGRSNGVSVGVVEMDIRIDLAEEYNQRYQAEPENPA